MLICPKCKCEYQEGYTTCNDCICELIEMPEIAEEDILVKKNSKVINFWRCIYYRDYSSNA